ncbi:hydantoinase/oxoprolinase family protein [Gluconacetobacter azotocaptans]|uniref:Hydantoinase/oxoprolinase family protein n=1 Tax=Gluconacetobacter azotocaptans TaxID=142834 RepID=A0A7W4PH72_9PROT|nr:hydantoinase/oxoprolinase family protein [Gluconacetobacter azotocaptans]MBB2190801.1 hydantoinase/oxoprolinase family protein [Gluconacetobacter azotocaptans]MBM9400753.1 hydantoinase/oxoprolinase family protein [Gluconacetobacter azotocaptans]GBQ30824.1 N-methylhydantoinase A [Gluconacetobacter azotocaptans DSM 13594]
MSWRIGVDSGGTFCDICLYDQEGGQLAIWKVSSTPDDPSRGIAAGVSEGLETVGAAMSQVGFLGHGTTVGTNALIQHKGARTGLITTRGFRDLIEIGRQRRPSLYDLNADKTPVLVDRDLRLEVSERVRSDGSVAVPLNEAELREAVRALRDAGVAAIAIGFLYAFLNPENERRAREIVEQTFPGVFISASYVVAPEFREYERFSTTVVNAYLGPVMENYINRLETRLQEQGLKVAPGITQSNGGVISFEAARTLPVRTVLSGPSTGVVAAQKIGMTIGEPNLITFDMGGTSSDVALLKEGKCRLMGEANVHGYPIKAPMLDIHTVGAGGGSLAFRDAGGLLKVGPQSCGADPGPVCYDKGNKTPSTTDANVVLHTLNPEFLLGGRMKINHDGAYSQIALLAETLGLDVMEAAQGIISVVTANMARAVRVISVQKGHDPRDYALMAFGGAGPLHAARLALELEMKRVIIPLTPGVMCALGLLLTDLRADFSVTRILPAQDDSVAVIAELVGSLRRQADAWFLAENVEEGARSLTFTADMRYAGQNYELPVAIGELDGVTAETIGHFVTAFRQVHTEQYGFASTTDPIQFVTFRVQAGGRIESANFPAHDDAGPDAGTALLGTREIWFPETGGFTACPVYDRSRLRAGNVLHGPAVVEQMDATTVILPGMTAHVEPHLNIIIETGL